MNPSLRVLIVDDHPLFREGLCSLLKRLAPQACLTQTSSIDDALTHAPDRFDLVLMDLHLPGTEGLDGLLRMKAHYESAAVVIISGDESPVTIRSAIQQGASGYVPKRTDVNVTIQALQLVLAHGVYLPPEAMLVRPADTPPPPSSPIEPLSERQRAVLRGLLQGKPNKVIAADLGLAEGTIKAHLWAVYQVLGVQNRAQAMYRAHELNLFGALGPERTTL